MKKKKKMSKVVLSVVAECFFKFVLYQWKEKLSIFEMIIVEGKYRKYRGDFGMYLLLKKKRNLETKFKYDESNYNV